MKYSPWYVAFGLCVLLVYWSVVANGVVFSGADTEEATAGTPRGPGTLHSHRSFWSSGYQGGK